MNFLAVGLSCVVGYLVVAIISLVAIRRMLKNAPLIDEYDEL